MGYFLLEKRNPHGQHFYTTRYKAVTAIVLHITAGLEDKDLIGRDQSAEATANYAAMTSRQVSWHSGADSDSVIDLLPPGYTAWHCAGFNSPSLGLEISKTTIDWDSAPTRWAAATIGNSAVKCSQWAKRYSIPKRLLTRAQALAGTKGFVYHSTMDPSRRSDPGPDFPIRMLWQMMDGNAEPQSWADETKEASVIVPDSHTHDIRSVQRSLDWVARVVLRKSFRSDGEQGVKVDGDWGANTNKALKAVRNWAKWWPHEAKQFEWSLQDRIRLEQARQGDPYAA